MTFYITADTNIKKGYIDFIEQSDNTICFSWEETGYSLDNNEYDCRLKGIYVDEEFCDFSFNAEELTDKSVANRFENYPFTVQVYVQEESEESISNPVFNITSMTVYHQDSWTDVDINKCNFSYEFVDD